MATTGGELCHMMGMSQNIMMGNSSGKTRSRSKLVIVLAGLASQTKA